MFVLACNVEINIRSASASTSALYTPLHSRRFKTERLSIEH